MLILIWYDRFVGTSIHSGFQGMFAVGAAADFFAVI
jgi:hypothetical protein